MPFTCWNITQGLLCCQKWQFKHRWSWETKTILIARWRDQTIRIWKLMHIEREGKKVSW